MTERQSLSLHEHMANARRARWAKASSEQRAAHAKMMVTAREKKRQKGASPTAFASPGIAVPSPNKARNKP